MLDLPFGLSSLLLVAAAGAIILIIFTCIHYCYKYTVTLRSEDSNITTAILDAANLQEIGPFGNKDGYMGYQNTDRLPLTSHEHHPSLTSSTISERTSVAVHVLE